MRIHSSSKIIIKKLAENNPITQKFNKITVTPKHTWFLEAELRQELTMSTWLCLKITIAMQMRLACISQRSALLCLSTAEIKDV